MSFAGGITFPQASQTCCDRDGSFFDTVGLLLFVLPLCLHCCSFACQACPNYISDRTANFSKMCDLTSIIQLWFRQQPRFTESHRCKVIHLFRSKSGITKLEKTANGVNVIYFNIKSLLLHLWHILNRWSNLTCPHCKAKKTTMRYLKLVDWKNNWKVNEIWVDFKWFKSLFSEFAIQKNYRIYKTSASNVTWEY